MGDVWLRLDHDQGRAVYEALAEHYGHTGLDTRALREDYEEERSRVDRLLDYVMDVGRMQAYPTVLPPLHVGEGDGAQVERGRR
jgi:hypothetical protein